MLTGKLIHFQWASETLLQWAKKVSLEIHATSYRHLLTSIMQDCPYEIHTHLSWTCTPNKKSVCADITENWAHFKETLSSSDDGSIHVPFTEFQSQSRLDNNGQVMTNNDGKEMKKLAPLLHKVNLSYLLNFIENILSNIHHRNHLRIFRNVKRKFLDMFLCLYLDVDFSDNLTIDIKCEPLSRYWSKTSITIHSGIAVDEEGKKYYHPYV